VTYIVVHKPGGPHYVVRTTDSVVLAECQDSTIAGEIAAFYESA